MLRFLVFAYWVVGIFPSTTDKYVVGDQQAILLLECLAFIATLYGEHIILLQYLQHVKELVGKDSFRLLECTRMEFVFPERFTSTI